MEQVIRQLKGKQAEKWCKAYRETRRARHLGECCNNPSYAKRKAMNACFAIKYELDGMCGKIVSYNTMQFTYGFLVPLGNGKTELHIITKDNHYVMEYDD